jgi:di/tricarboxylate transporter
VTSAVTGLLSIHVAFVMAGAVFVLLNFLSFREAYESINWPIILLLGAFLPVGGALESTGAAQEIADVLLKVGDYLPTIGVLIALLVVTMLLTDLMNNAATAVLMAPIALTLAQSLGSSSDAFLMAVAMGASSSFLTPVGHQSNLLVMTPGGYRFGDYWPMGLLLEALIVVVAAPVIAVVWSL